MTELLKIIIPIRRDVERSAEVDILAQEATKRLSATPVTDLRYVSRGPWADDPSIDGLTYEGTGTPKEEYK